MRLFDRRADDILMIAAKNGKGMDEIAVLLEKTVLEGRLYIERIYPFDQLGKIAVIRQKGQLLEEEYTDTGVNIKAYVPLDIYGAVEID